MQIGQNIKHTRTEMDGQVEWSVTRYGKILDIIGDKAKVELANFGSIIVTEIPLNELKPGFEKK